MTITIDRMFAWGVYGVMVWLVALVISRARVMRPLRRWVRQRSDYWGEGVSCHFCISVHVAFWLGLVFRPQVLPFASGWWFVDLLGTAATGAGLSALVARTIGRTQQDGILHPDEKAEREELARVERETMEELWRRAA